MGDFKIRKVVEEDFIEISHVAEKCSPMITERISIYHIFTKFFKKTSLIVEDDNGRIEGYLLGFISQDDPENTYIHQLCLAPSLRGQNMALNLLDEFTKIVSNLGIKKISLVCKPSNKTAIKFYHKIGFLPQESDKTVKIDGINLFKDYDGPCEDKIIFYKYI